MLKKFKSGMCIKGIFGWPKLYRNWPEKLKLGGTHLNSPVW